MDARSPAGDPLAVTRTSPRRDATAPLLPRPVRGLLVAAGGLCVALGALGVVLPLLPTTPFLIAAAACFARSSPRLHRALLASRTFGPLIRHWRDSRAIPRRAKWTAVALIALVGGSSVAFFVPGVAARAGVALLLLVLATWIGSRPDAEESGLFPGEEEGGAP